MNFDPAKHHRRSIRLKGHDYAGGGLYFVTICAHREFIAVTDGAPFEGALKKLMEERLRITEEKCPQMRWGEWVIMPDHFHALIYMKAGKLRLGDVVGGFKSAVSREWKKAILAEQERARKEGARQASRRTGEACLAPSCLAQEDSLSPRFWHRNYYERIVRSEEAERRIAEYIRMNPWRCVQELGDGLRGIGNPALWTREKLGVLCSRGAPKIGRLPDAEVYFGGWHSPKEKEIFQWLIDNRKPVIACPAWGIEKSSFASGVLQALEENRMLILEMRDTAGNLAAAEARNRFVIEESDALFAPHVTKGGMLERLLSDREVHL
jgi:putative transposase